MVVTGIVSNNMSPPPSPECYMTLCRMTIYNDPITDLELIAEFD